MQNPIRSSHIQGGAAAGLVSFYRELMLYVKDASSQVEERVVYLLNSQLALTIPPEKSYQVTYERALIFLLLRLRRRTRFFLHLALILNDASKLLLAM